MLLALLADNLSWSPASRTNFPWTKLRASLPCMARSFTNSVVTAIQAVVLTCEKETV